MSDAHATGGPPRLVQDGARAPTHGERVRTLVAGRGDATLSTIARDPAGYPFGSVVTYALDERGAPLLLMSTMSEHAQNLAADERASLLVSETGDGAGRLAVARATLVGTLRAVEGEDHDAAAASYREAHPDAFWIEFDDFFVARLSVEAIRFVRGFGEMSWVEPDEYATAAPDPLAAVEVGIVQHMNDDHADALAAIVRDRLAVSEPGRVRMLSCDRYGFEVELTAGDHELAFGRIGFDRVLDEPAQARDAMIALTRSARGR